MDGSKEVSENNANDRAIGTDPGNDRVGGERGRGGERGGRGGRGRRGGAQSVSGGRGRRGGHGSQSGALGARGGHTARGGRGTRSERGGSNSHTMPAFLEEPKGLRIQRGGAGGRGNRGSSSNRGAAQGRPGKRPGVCYTFQSKGFCSFGDRCWYSHNTVSDNSPTPSNELTTVSPEASSDVVDFTARVQIAVSRRNFKLKLDDPRDRALWMQSWSAVAVGAQLKAGPALLRALMCLPASSAVAPPPNDVIHALLNIVNATTAPSSSSKHPSRRASNSIVHVLDLVAEAIEKRLLHYAADVPRALRPSCAEAVGRLRVAAHTALVKIMGDMTHSERAAGLLSRLLKMLEDYRLQLECTNLRHEEDANDGDIGNAEERAWSGWRSPSLSWLQRGVWLDSPQLAREYDSVEDYADTLCNLVTMLTFYWGAGALFAKCRHRGHDDRPCDQPLCTVVPANHRQVCGRRLQKGEACGRHARWRCSRNGHDVACDQCMRKMQGALVGKPTSRASTDLYDAVVERETLRRDGFVYILSKLTSRKPPTIAPNWKTTYRLKCSALVGVVRLSASCEPLSSQSRIEWAEVVPVSAQSGHKLDFKERANGRIAIRLLSRADISTLKGDLGTLDQGARVALIDLQVFVPEVLSVLSTVTDPALVEHLRQLPFSGSLIGRTTATPVPAFEDNVDLAISKALTTTEIDVVVKLPPARRSALVIELTALARSANLYGTQLEAFAAALTKSLHCTQGPPGTGKSYVGVVLVHALDLIRRYAIAAGNAVGPIVVLSYKNHALDELLLDVLKGYGKRSNICGGLVRCGKSEDPLLAAYGERTSFGERRAAETLGNRVDCLRFVQRTLRDWRSLRVVLIGGAVDEEVISALSMWKPSRAGKDEGGMESAKAVVVQAVRMSVRIAELEEEPNAMAAYGVLESMMHVDDMPMLFEQRVFLRGITGLEQGVEHWIEPPGVNRPIFLLESWLDGSVPPPRCEAANENGRCFMVSLIPGGFCPELHKCKFESGCDGQRVGAGVYCDLHQCKNGINDGEVCRLPRLMDSEVCATHACERCMMLRCVPILRKAGSACIEHSCAAQNCTKMYHSGQLPYCQDHCCVICHFIVTKRDPRDAKSILRFQGSDYCKEHKCTEFRCVGFRLFDCGPQNFCIIHACVACDGTRNRISVEAPQLRLCDEHSCGFVDVFNERCGVKKDPVANFCVSHECRICREEGLPLDCAVVDNPPRNVCEHHPLCTSILSDGAICNAQAVGKTAYCKVHAKRSWLADLRTGEREEKVQCAGKTKRGKPCKTEGTSIAGSIFYCAPHADQKPESAGESDDDSDFEDEDEDMDISNDEYCPDWNSIRNASMPGPDDSIAGLGNNAAGVDVQCAGTTKKNKRCKTTGKALNLLSTFYCEAHVDQKPTDAPNPNDEDAMLGMTDEILPPPVELQDEDETGAVIPQPIVEEAELIAVDVETARAAIPEFDSHSDLNAVCDGADVLGPDSDDQSGAENERAAFGMGLDEGDVLSDEFDSSEDECNAQMQHLEDIVGLESASDSDSEVNSESDFEAVAHELHENSSACRDSKDWTWDQSLQQRWLSVADLLGRICPAVAKLATLADGHVERARLERAEAAAFSFKNARVIGATVVGATRRLHALRASEPFAMVVEEACEVMEPTLVSVLAVRSLCKLELIGDHRQLPAFVQQCWFAIQTTHPSIKISLFERLVTDCETSDGEANGAQYTILDVQRRMRPEISELTRCEYEDVVGIQDHETTIGQRIGDRNLSTVLRDERNLWNGKGRFVPGVKPQVFFWDLETQEGRAAVGLSRCNYGEAEACCALVSWLLHSGVPPAAISVITPYKGQKITILKLLRKVKGAIAFRRPNDTSPNFSKPNEVVVSTVDRYQGDENDIVILSLVSTRPGNRFVALRNRFIVATSRARIGFYILGASGAVSNNLKGGSGPSHWRRLLKDLDSAEAEGEAEEKRIGKKLIICCSRHRDVIREISDPNEFPAAEERSEFCKEPCSFLLPWCEHPCQVNSCHSPSKIPHTSKCETAVPRPCEHHKDVKLSCFQVSQKMSKASCFAEALDNYECEVIIEYRRPDCPHAIELSCHQHSLVLAGDETLEACLELVADYVNPSCEHRIKTPTCCERRLWEETPPPCRQMIEHVRPCGCRARMSCDDSTRESSMDNPPKCREAVTAPRPRCSHQLPSRCFEATALRQIWSSQDGEAISSSPPLVLHGIEYGPSETAISIVHSKVIRRVLPPCRVTTEYKMSCGHVMRALCNEAFQLAAGDRSEPHCKEGTMISSPICGHKILAACFVAKMSLTFPGSLWINRLDSDGNMETVADENAIEAEPPIDTSMKKLSGACNLQVNIVRKCGHVTRDLPCSRLFSILRTKQLPPCSALVSIQRSCGHSYQVPCHREGDPPPLCNAPVDDMFSYPCKKIDHDIRPGMCSELSRLKGLIDPKCPFSISCVRARCKHIANDIPCHLETSVAVATPGICLDGNTDCVVEAGKDYSDAAVGVKECLDLVVYRRPCDHEEVDIPCSTAFSWAMSPDDAPPCTHRVEIDSPLCGHSILVPCFQKANILDWNPWCGQPPQRIIQRYDGDAITCPIVIEDDRVPVRSASNILAAMRCGNVTRYVRSCAHSEDIECFSIFDVLTSKCEQLENSTCEVCGFEDAEKCHELKEKGGPRPCKNVVEKKCTTCNVNMTHAECFKKNSCCEREVRADLPCGHAVTWTCGEDDPRVRLDIEPCLFCTRVQWLDALEKAKDLLNQQQLHECSHVCEGNEVPVAAAGGAQGKYQNATLPSTFCFESLINNLRKRALAVLPSEFVKEVSEVEHGCFELVLEAYLSILSRNVDILGNAIANETRDGLSVSPPPDIEDGAGAYDIIYHIIRGKYSFNMVDTQFGYGAMGTLLSMESLVQDCDKHGTNGTLSISIGAAFRYQTLEGSPPFRLEIDEIRKKAKSEKMDKKFRKRFQKENARARRLMKQFVETGYDCVSRDAARKPFDRVYWVPGSVISLCNVEVQLLRECDICLDHCEPKKGWLCSENHYLCRDCFSGHAQRASDADTLARTVDREGMLLCPHDGCTSKYELPVLLNQSHDASEDELMEIHAALQNLRMSAHTRQEVQVALETQKRQLEAEFVRIQEIQDVDQRQAETLRLRIVDEILTLRCPNEACKMAFVDFTGCFALACSSCRTHFCAWCIRPQTVVFVHEHVATCQEGSAPGYIHGAQVFDAHQRARRKRLAVERLQAEDPNIRNRTLAALRVELSNLGIVISPADFS